jgi:uncharacterized protein (DUF2062 family)
VVERALHEGFSVLVVDDGSTDGSLGMVADLPVERCVLPKNRGKGAAILAGAVRAATLGYKAIITIDADGQHDPAEARQLLAAAEGHWPAIVIGVRQMDTDNVPRSSLFGRDFSNFWVRIECGATLPDTQSGYRIYPVDFLIDARFFSRRYTFEIEVLVRGAWAGLELLSFPVSVYYPPAKERISHFHKFKDNLRLTVLHTLLVGRSLVPWPHRRRYQSRKNESRGMPWLSVFQPLSFFRKLSVEHNSTGQLAAAVFVGIWVGSLPIIPFGIAAIIYVTHRLHLNKLAAVGASNLCCFPFVPLICIEVGHLIRYGRLWNEFNHETMIAQIHLRLWEWLMGSLVIGPVLGVAGGILTYFTVRALRRRSG